MRISSWVGRDGAGKIKLPEATPKSSLEVQNRMLAILDEQGELTGYESFEGVDKWLMLAIWTKHDGMRKVLGSNYDAFCEWFQKQATYPDYIRRGREYMVSKGIVEVPAHVKKRMQGKAKAFQGQFGGLR